MLHCQKHGHRCLDYIHRVSAHGFSKLVNATVCFKRFPLCLCASYRDQTWIWCVWLQWFKLKRNTWLCKNRSCCFLSLSISLVLDISLCLRGAIYSCPVLFLSRVTRHISHIRYLINCRRSPVLDKTLLSAYFFHYCTWCTMNTQCCGSSQSVGASVALWIKFNVIFRYHSAGEDSYRTCIIMAAQDI